MARVLITGMSGVGKSSVVKELRRRGYVAYDADDDGYSEPTAAGAAWHWRVDAVATLFASAGSDLLFFAGCSDEQAEFYWDCRVLLTAPEPVILDRVTGRTTNPFGQSSRDRDTIRRDLREVEPLLRRTADVVIDATQALDHVVDEIVAAALGTPEAPGATCQPSRSC